MKGISPIIATILLIAFAVGAGGIVSLWLTGFTSTQTATVGTIGEKVIKCANSVLDITALSNKSFTPPKGSTAAGGDFNLSVVYYTGTEDLYNFTITLTDNSGATYTMIHTSKFNKTDSGLYPMKPGEKYTFALNFTSNITATPITEARVSALCQSTYAVSRAESV